MKIDDTSMFRYNIIIESTKKFESQCGMDILKDLSDIFI